MSKWIVEAMSLSNEYIEYVEYENTSLIRTYDSAYFELSDAVSKSPEMLASGGWSNRTKFKLTQAPRQITRAHQEKLKHNLYG